MSFLDDAMRTVSDKFYEKEVDDILGDAEGCDGEPVGFPFTIERLLEVIHDVDRLKKALYYGKKPTELDAVYVDLPVEVKWDRTRIDLLHAALGLVTEAGEILSVLWETEVDLDKVREELGDAAWYYALGLKAVGQTVEENQAAVIRKLRARYPEKFTEQRAIERDLDAEHQAWLG